MRLGRLHLVLALALALAAPGCLANMGDLKRMLGQEEPPPPTPTPEPEPDPVAPVAKAQANITITFTGAKVRFTAEDSHDIDGAIVRYAWTFGDAATGSGRVVEHAFARAGEYRVELTVTDDDELRDTDRVTITVREPNRPPSAIIEARDLKGRIVTGGDVGTAIEFSAQRSVDPEGGFLEYEWDFGNGVGAKQQKFTVKYADPGQYLVTLTVRDEKGASASASRLVYQNENTTATGEFGPTDAAGATDKLAFTVPAGLTSVTVKLTFPTSAGANDATLTVLDSAGAEVARVDEPVQPGDTADRTRVITLTPDLLRTFEPGEWSVVVAKVKGLRFSYTVTTSVQF